MMQFQSTYDLYKDMSNRTKGEIYLGVVGPVRTGKSTFIKRFMEEMVLPSMVDQAEMERAMDELPQSADGKTITTTEPKFIPATAADVMLEQDVEVKIRLIDCVGYMVDGAVGHMEEERERYVKTPWFEEAIPFSQAASMGTDKVIRDHSTIGVVVTSDGTIGTSLRREDYKKAEDMAVTKCKEIGKPFIVILNTRKPYDKGTKEEIERMEQLYQVPAMALNCQEMGREDIVQVLQKLVYAFPLVSLQFYLPGWTRMLQSSHPVKTYLADTLGEYLKKYNTMNDIVSERLDMDEEFIKDASIKNVDFSVGNVTVWIQPKEEYYYQMLSEWFREPVNSERDLLELLKQYADMKEEYDALLDGIVGVKAKGYGMVRPLKENIVIEKPIVVKQGNKYGVKIKAHGPSVHMIKADVETEIAPIVGDKQQAEDLVRYIEKDGKEEEIWNTNIFGKTVLQLVNDGMNAKMARIEEESQQKLQESMQKIVNDSNGGMICIII